MFTAGPALFRFHGYTPKKDLHLHFLTYQAFKSREGIVFSKKSLWVTDQGILDLKKLTSIQTIWLIGVLEQGDYEYIGTPSCVCMYVIFRNGKMFW